MRILILGGTGLISTGITRRLRDARHDVVHFNRGRTGADEAAETIRGERGSRDDLRRAADGGFDAVIDMICYTPDEARVAAEAFAGRTPRYLMCSTVDVYTAPAVRYPIDESHPRDPAPEFTYAFDKARAERVLRSAEAEGAFSLTILRPAATYHRGVVAPLGDAALYLDRLRRGAEVILHGDGTSLWVATHRDDVARAFVGALENPRATGRDYNVAGDEFMTWERYWRIAAAAIGVAHPRFVRVPTRELRRLAPDLAEWCDLNFQHHNLIDSSAARRDLSFRYTVPWAVGARGLAGLDTEPDPALAARFERLLAEWTARTAALDEV